MGRRNKLDAFVDSKRNEATQLTGEGGDEIKEFPFLEEKDKCEAELIVANNELTQFANVAPNDLQELLFEEDYLTLLDDKARNHLHSENSAAIARTMKTFLLLMFICFDMLIGFGQGNSNIVCSSKLKDCSVKLVTVAPAKSTMNKQVGNFFSSILDTQSWPARWQCGTWTSFHGWLYIISDITIGISYFMIPLILWYFLSKRKQRTPFKLIITLFIVFILACGLTHFIDAAIFWWPAYRLSALTRFITAFISLGTVFALVKVTPLILQLKDTDELEKIVEETNVNFVHANKDLEARLKEVSDYKYALDESSILAITERSGIIKHVNDNFCKISKYTREELIGKDHRIINSGYHSKEYIRELWATISHGKIWKGELKNKAKDGTVYWVDTTIVPFLNEEGKPYQYVAIRADITERKKAEKNLAQSLKEVSDYKYALEESSIVAITDQKGIIKYANDNFCKISKYSRKELIGKDHRIINSGFHSKEFIRNLWVTIANGKIWKGELKNKAKDGTIYWVDTTIVPFLNEPGKPYQYIAIRADITERKKLEEEQALAASIVNSSDDAILSKSLDGIVTSWNRGAEKVFGYRPNEIIGNHISVLIPSHLRHEEKEITEKIKKGEVIDHYDTERIKKDGKTIHVSITISPIRDSSGTIIGASKISRDIADRMAVKELRTVKEELISQGQEKEKRAAELIIANQKLAAQNKEKEKRAAELVVANKELAFQGKEKERRATELLIANQELLFQNEEKEKRATELAEMLERVSFLASIADNIQDPVISTDNDFTLTRWNKPAEKLLEWKSEEVIGKDATGIFKTSYPNETRVQIFELLEANGIWQGEVIYHTKSDRPVYVLSTISYIKDAEGNAMGYLVLIRDISLRKIAEQALSKLNEELEQRVRERTEAVVKTLEEKKIILESIGDAFFAVDKQWTVTYWNRIAEMALGVKRFEILDKNLWEIFSDSIDSVSYLKYHEALATNQVVHFEDFYAALSKWYEISAYPSENGLSVFFKDITERKKAADEIKTLNENLEKRVSERTEELVIANKELESFSYSVSHDLRAPLRAINGNATILEEDYLEKLDDDGIKVLHSIQRSSTKMGVLIDDLLAFSKLGRKQVTLSGINMKELVQSIIEELLDENIRDRTTINLRPLPLAQGDYSLIKQVWVNLLSNAIKYSRNKPKTEIEIGAYEKNHLVVYYIKDNGVGFDMQYYDKLFGVFQRLHSHEEFDGTGIGLANVQKIVNRHNGTVWAESKPKEGACFYFSLPSNPLNEAR